MQPEFLLMASWLKELCFSWILLHNAWFLYKWVGKALLTMLVQNPSEIICKLPVLGRPASSFFSFLRITVCTRLKWLVTQENLRPWLISRFVIAQPLTWWVLLPTPPSNWPRHWACGGGTDKGWATVQLHASSEPGDWVTQTLWITFSTWVMLRAVTFMRRVLSSKHPASFSAWFASKCHWFYKVEESLFWQVKQEKE